MKTIAVLGGGPAGAFAAERTASAGLQTVVIDEKLAWEKPCGGGITYKAYSQYPFLLRNATPKRLLTKTALATDSAGIAELDLTAPIVIYTRKDLNGMLLDRARAAGAHLEKTRVLELKRVGSRWLIKTSTGELEADYCIVATGARNPLRNVGTAWTSTDTALALGYHIPTQRDHIDLHFFPNFAGYIWVFPREGQVSAGICAKGQPASQLRARLESYLKERGVSLSGAEFYAHVLPSLERPAWRTNRVAGEGWMAVGDAAGLVDPVTGEGIYYAMRSAEIATDVLLSSEKEAPVQYASALRRDFVDDLEFGSHLSAWLYNGKFLGESVPARMIRFARRSSTIRSVLQDLFAGTQNYLALKPRLKSHLAAALRDVVLSFSLGQVAKR